MPTSASTLVVGELIEIKYRIANPLLEASSASEFCDRWIPAEIVHQDEEAFPIARLADGQITDIRAYMTWRRLSSGGRGGASSSH